MRLNGQGPRRLLQRGPSLVLGCQCYLLETLFPATTRKTEQAFGSVPTSYRTVAARPLSTTSADAFQIPRKTHIPTAPSEHSPLLLNVSQHQLQDIEIGSTVGRENRDHTAQTSHHVSTDQRPRTTGKASKFAKWERGKEHKLLVNRLLKDKGETSYDWRKPLLLLLDKYYAYLRSRNPGENNNETPNLDVDDPEDVASERSNTSRIRRVWYRNQEYVRLARDIPSLSVWSIPALVTYIEDLTRSQHRKDRLPEISQVHGKGSSNVADVVHTLEEIFNSPAMMKYISIEAYDLGLKFFYQYGLISKATALFFKMENSTLEIPSKTFNIMLSGAARSRDLHNFTFILHKAIQRGLEPDGETWKMLLMASPSQEAKTGMIQYMQERGITNRLPNNQGLKGLIVRTEMAFHIDKHGNRREFLEYLDERYGEVWALRFTCNKLLHEFSKTYGIPKTLELLPGLKERGFTPDEVSLATLLRHCFLLKQHRNAIKTLQCFEEVFQLKPGKVAYETLFRMAWRDQLLHFARVVWSSARIRGQVTFVMRRLVSPSLSPSTHHKKANFNELASRFVLTHGKPYKSVKAELEDILGPGRHQSIVESANAQLLHHAQDAGNVVEPGNLGELLLQALHLDLQRVAKRRSKEASLEEMLQDAALLDTGVLLLAKEYITKTAQSYESCQGLAQPHSEILGDSVPAPLPRPKSSLVDAPESDSSNSSREERPTFQLFSQPQTTQKAGSFSLEMEKTRTPPINAQTAPRTSAIWESNATKTTTSAPLIIEPLSTAREMKEAISSPDESLADSLIPSQHLGTPILENFPNIHSRHPPLIPNGILVDRQPHANDLLSLPMVFRRGFKWTPQTPIPAKQRHVKYLSPKRPTSRQLSAVPPVQETTLLKPTDSLSSEPDKQGRSPSSKKSYFLTIRKHVTRESPKEVLGALPAEASWHLADTNVLSQKLYNERRDLAIKKTSSRSIRKISEPSYKTVPTEPNIHKHYIKGPSSSPQILNQQHQPASLPAEIPSHPNITQDSPRQIRRKQRRPPIRRLPSLRNLTSNPPMSQQQQHLLASSPAKELPLSTTARDRVRRRYERRRPSFRKISHLLTIRKHAGYPVPKVMKEEVNRVKDAARLHTELAASSPAKESPSPITARDHAQSLHKLRSSPIRKMAPSLYIRKHLGYPVPKTMKEELQQANSPTMKLSSPTLTKSRTRKAQKQRRRPIVRRLRASLTIRKHHGHPDSRTKAEELKKVQDRANETARLHASLDQMLSPDAIGGTHRFSLRRSH